MSAIALLGIVVSAVVAHELAHVAATRAVGHDIFEIQIGTGPQWSTRLGGVDLRLGVLPLGGHVQTGSRSGDGFRWRSAVIAGSGVAANVGLVAVGVAIGSEAVVGFNIAAVVANLWPGARRRMGAGSSDGRVLLDVARGDADALAEERSGWYCVQAMRAREAGDLDGARALVDDGVVAAGETRALLAVAGVVAFEQRRFVDVVDAYAQLIDDRRVSIASRAGFAADAAWAASLSEDAALHRLALPWAMFAHRVRPRLRRRRLVLALAQVGEGQHADALRTVGDLADPSADAVRVLALVGLGRDAEATALHRESVVPGVAADHPLRARCEQALAGAGPAPG